MTTDGCYLGKDIFGNCYDELSDVETVIAFLLRGSLAFSII